MVHSHAAMPQERSTAKDLLQQERAEAQALQGQLQSDAASVQGLQDQLTFALRFGQLCLLCCTCQHARSAAQIAIAGVFLSLLVQQWPLDAPGKYVDMDATVNVLELRFQPCLAALPAPGY